MNTPGRNLLRRLPASWQNRLGFSAEPREIRAMAGKPGIRNLHGMRGRQKGGLVAAAPRSGAPAGTLRDLVPRFLERMTTRGYSPGSVELQHRALDQFLGWCDRHGFEDPSGFTRSRLEDYQLFLFHYRSPRGERPLAINTQLARLGCIRRFFAWLCRDGILPANPASDLDLPRKQARALPRCLAHDEIERLLAMPDITSPFGLRDRCILELFYSCGVRRTEMTRLDVGDYDPHARTLLVRRGKNGKSRLLPVGGHAATWLDSYLAEARPLLAFLPAESALFLSGYGTAFSPVYLGNWVAKQMKKSGIRKGGACHLFRHSCATDMHRGGADIRHVQEMLGHARLDTTQIYTHVSITALQEVHARCHPRGGDPARVPVCPVPCAQTTGQMQEIAILAAPEEVRASCPASEPAAPARIRPDDESPPGSALSSPIALEGPNPLPPAANGNLARSESNDCPAMDETCYGYRYLDTQLGRWLSRDPIGERGGLNVYAFVGNNSCSSADMWGLVEVLASLPDASQIVPEWTSDILPFEVAGETAYRGIVGCACGPDRITCIVSADAIIYLNWNIPNDKLFNEHGELTNWNNVFGHEQRHVIAINQAVQRNVIIPLSLEPHDPLTYLHALQLAIKYKIIMNGAISEAAKHSDDPKDPRPADRRDYKPQPGSLPVPPKPTQDPNPTRPRKIPPLPRNITEIPPLPFKPKK